MTGIAKAVPVIDIGSSYRRTHFTGIVTVASDMPPRTPNPPLTLV